MTSSTPKNPALKAKIDQMALHLAPLVQVTTGEAHPDFPATLLHYWLLTSAQLDDLAHFYHQCTPSRWTFEYPKTMSWSEGLTLEEKRRKLGKFIGLRGCDTPVRLKTEDEIWEEAKSARDTQDEEIWRRKMGW